MIWVILFGISAFVVFVSYIIGKPNKKVFDVTFFTCAGSTLFFIIFGIIFGVIKPPMATQYADEATLYSSSKIANMQDSKDIEGKTEGRISGNIFYMSGYMSEQEKTELYYYYLKWEGDSLITDKVKADETKIKYTSDGEAPHIDTYVYYQIKDESNDEDMDDNLSTLKFWLTPSFFINIFNFKEEGQALHKFAYYELYIPQGSITEEYNIDLR